ncbi:hypothetical protein A2U01_0098053, partial [Trifolium medium]|nr:hypothetical protein [Trifolium medium]
RSEEVGGQRTVVGQQSSTGGGLYLQALRCLSQNRAQRYSLSAKLRNENCVPGSPV